VRPGFCADSVPSSIGSSPADRYITSARCAWNAAHQASCPNRRVWKATLQAADPVGVLTQHRAQPSNPHAQASSALRATPEPLRATPPVLHTNLDPLRASLASLPRRGSEPCAQECGCCGRRSEACAQRSNPCVRGPVPSRFDALHLALRSFRPARNGSRLAPRSIGRARRSKACAQAPPVACRGRCRGAPPLTPLATSTQTCPSRRNRGGRNKRIRFIFRRSGDRTSQGPAGIARPPCARPVAPTAEPVARAAEQFSWHVRLKAQDPGF
jgi:hypothetical protein